MRRSAGTSEKSDFGQAATQSPQAVQSSSSTTGSACAFMVIASKSQETSQSARPRQPQLQALAPPATTAAAAQVGSPS